MALPPYSNDVRWKRYEIDTPTFRLNPVEKPDMSPYLVHMTGKKAIAAILRGEGARPAPPQDHGYLLAAIPEHSARDPLGGQGAFGAEVVCFTESPTFALDFFRYRSFRRWRDDQRFGIGFSKEQLVHRGVRPVLYADDDLTRNIIAAYHEVQDRESRICDDPALNERLNEILGRAYPLLFPLLETAGAQGFMWEREWRYPDAEGLAFSFDEIEVICCPPDEELDIRRLLGAHADHVRFVRSWQEYDDVTDYLRRQEAVWAGVAQPNEGADLAVQIEAVRSQVAQREVAVHSLESYSDLARHLSQEAERAAAERARLEEELSGLRAKLEELEKAQAEQARARREETRRRNNGNDDA